MRVCRWKCDARARLSRAPKGANETCNFFLSEQQRDSNYVICFCFFFFFKWSLSFYFIIFVCHLEFLHLSWSSDAKRAFCSGAWEKTVYMLNAFCKCAKRNKAEDIYRSEHFATWRGSCTQDIHLYHSAFKA